MRLSLLILTALILNSCGNNIQKYTILRNCNIIPMNKDTVLLKKNVIIQNNKIIAIGNEVDKKFLNNESIIIDCQDKYILPGFFDSHFHYGRNTEQYRLLDSLLLSYGVTNVFSFHGSEELMDYRKQIDNGTAIGPKIISTGRNQREDDLTDNEALKRLKEQQEEGYEFIKIYTHLSKNAFEVYNKKAKDYDLRLVGHIPRKIGFYELMATNQELICHAEEILYNEPINYLMGVDEASEPDYEFIDTIATTIKKHDKWMSPTLVAFKSILEQSQVADFSTSFKEPIDEIAAYWSWLPPKNQIPSKFATYGKRFRLEKGFLFQKLLVKRLDEQNVKLLAGTDSPAYWNLIPGQSLHRELHLLKSCGLNEYDVLRTATVNPAEFLNLAKDYGTIEVNKVANIIILNTNPLENIDNTTDIYKVVLNGREYKNNAN
jgi:adenylate kinase family enzyme